MTAVTDPRVFEGRYPVRDGYRPSNVLADEARVRLPGYFKNLGRRMVTPPVVVLLPSGDLHVRVGTAAALTAAEKEAARAAKRAADDEYLISEVEFLVDQRVHPTRIARQLGYTSVVALEVRLRVGLGRTDLARYFAGEVSWQAAKRKGGGVSG